MRFEIFPAHQHLKAQSLLHAIPLGNACNVTADSRLVRMSHLVHSLSGVCVNAIHTFAASLAFPQAAPRSSVLSPLGSMLRRYLRDGRRQYCQRVVCRIFLFHHRACAIFTSEAGLLLNRPRLTVHTCFDVTLEKLVRSRGSSS